MSDDMYDLDKPLKNMSLKRAVEELENWIESGDRRLAQAIKIVVKHVQSQGNKARKKVRVRRGRKASR